MNRALHLALFPFMLGLLACDPAGNQSSCDPESCKTPPASKCLEDVAVSYTDTSICDVANQCQYERVETDCSEDAKVCVAGSCLSAQEALCADVVCETPPEDTCAGNTVIIYNDTGTCNENGFCSYDFTETLCEAGQVCENAQCVGDAVDPCEGVQCNTPPADTCNGNVVVTFEQTGICNDGECIYTSSETECTAGTVCSNGQCLDESDPCAGIQCLTPPDNTCNDNTAVTYTANGICTEGTCNYEATETACGDSATCMNGECINDDPCEGITCTTPPADTCDGNTALIYAQTGTCTDGNCSYDENAAPCGDTATCVAGVCVPNSDPCENVTCESPPMDYCVLNNAITYPQVGTCVDGDCSYEATTTACESNTTCTAGVCVPNGDPCENMTCETPPDTICQGQTAITYADTGTCTNGSCSYESTETNCRPAANCENGICVAITEIKVVINEIYYNPPTSQGDDLDYEFLELYNAGATVNLEGWQFTSGIEHTFENYTFENGTYLILVSHEEQYVGLSVPVIEWNLSNLHNDGETLTLVDASAVEMDTVTYDKTASSGWYTAANGQGKSLELVDPWSDNSDPANWHASEAEHGTPGAANSN